MGVVPDEARHVEEVGVQVTSRDFCYWLQGLFELERELARQIADEIDREILEDLDGSLAAIAKDHDDYFWPHKGGCPLCGSDAYVGLSTVECSMTTCQNFTWKDGM